MKQRCFCVFLVFLLLASVFLNLSLSLPHAAADSPPDVYVGVDIAYGDVADAKALMDQVSPYTNLIIIGSSKITDNVAKLNETFQYAYDKGLSFISLTPNFNTTDPTNRTIWYKWFDYAKKAWGNRLLGFYVFDEIGGRQLDKNQTIVTIASDYVDAAYQFESRVGGGLMSIVTNSYNLTYFPLFTSDYALYWFDYKAGYDVIFAELGWNYSKPLNIALDRGAATMENKDWGAMILWKYTVPPYIESGGDLYNDLVLAYSNGAKYIAVFDANEGWTSGILQTEHFQALQMFWHDIQSNSGVNRRISDRTAYVLPNGYGFGFRGPDDKIWGLWEADDLAIPLSISVNDMLNTYGTSLDLIYDDGLQYGSTYGYNQVFYWNPPEVPPPTFPTPIPMPTSSPTNSPSLSPSSSQSPTSPVPTPSLSPSPTPSPSPTSSPTEKPTSSSDPPKDSWSINYAYALATGVAAAVVAAVVFVFRKRR